MEEQRLLGVDFESCPVCTGVWLDEGELEAVTRGRGGEALCVEILTDRRTEFLCPHCKPSALLFEGEHTLGDDFLLDKCHRCKGLWFDRGEFPRLLQTHRYS